MNYFSSLVFKAKEYESLKAKFNSISQRSIGRSSSQNLPLKEIKLKTLEKRVNIYEKELDSLTHRLSKPVSTEISLEVKVNSLSKKLSSLEKDNFRLNACKVILPKIVPNNIKAEVEESYRQVKSLKYSIKELEEQLEANPTECRNMQEKYKKLFEDYEKLREEAGNFSTVVPNKNYFKKKKYLETLTTSWKSNVSKYEQRIVEMEEELSQLKETYMHLTAQSFKKSQQQRLLKMSYDEITLKRESATSSVRPDIDHPGVSFMYKPSVRTLYNI